MLFRTCISDLQIKMGLASMFYQHIGKRTSTFALAICVAAIGFERGFDRSEKILLEKHLGSRSVVHLMIVTFSFADYLWESHNKGKLWKDIRVKYENQEEEA